MPSGKAPTQRERAEADVRRLQAEAEMLRWQLRLAENVINEFLLGEEFQAGIRSEYRRVTGHELEGPVNQNSAELKFYYCVRSKAR